MSSGRQDRSAGSGTRLTPAFRPQQVRKEPPCQAGCPNCGDIRGWIGTVAQRSRTGLSREDAFAQAWRMITDVNPFPSVLGRVCPHPCEAHCNRGELDEPLAINAMERFLGDWAIENRLPLPALEPEAGGEWIGVVGAGPSGLSFAYQMARRGYRVTVYEGREQAGGMLRFGVPDYRLPPEILDAEVQRILNLGVELHLNTQVGQDVTLAELRERHTSLYLGLGAQLGRGLGLPGEEGPSVWTGVDYLERANQGRPAETGARVLVVGGGNTAVDAARTARRTGATVTLMYRRTREEMPAIAEEVEDALEEGIELMLLATPVSVERDDDGRLRGVEACRMELGEPDASGRRRPVAMPGSEFRLAVDTLITAVSQSPALKGFEALDRDGSWLVSGDGGWVADGISAGGDLLGLGIAGNAIVQGRRAAESVHERLRGGGRLAAADAPLPAIGPDRIIFDHKPGSAAVKTPKRDGEQRVRAGMSEVAGTITESQFLQEVERCYSCGSCMGCEQCAMYCTSSCFTRLEEVGPGMYFSLALDECKECGKCIEVCPCGFLDVS